jgi:ubiquinone/menaquinone biosynthesis C-methylase UbiE
MPWFSLPRKPEPEVMSDAGEVEAYASAAGQSYLDSIDNTLVQQVLEIGTHSGILRDSRGGRGLGRIQYEPMDRTTALLDVGTGPGGIPLKIARRCPQLMVVGVDRSVNMVVAARRSALELGLAGRARFLVGDAGKLSFPNASFDLVISNSLLHHVPDPIPVFNEMARVVKPAGIVLLRDLRRPSRLVFPLHVRWFGRYYSGLMRELYINSVGAAYTAPELARLLQRSALADARLFFHGRTHLGFTRSSNRGHRG